MTREKKPPRVKIPPDVSAQVLVASANTCCVCHNPDRRVQIHHVDDDRTNNVPGNLAVLCIPCHDKTQVKGGFGRALTPEVVRQSRDEWLQIVKEQKRVQSGHPTPTREPRRTITHEQARRNAQRLRDLYTPFFAAVLALRDYADSLALSWGVETWEARQQRLLPAANEALQTIREILPQLRVEPGTLAVCGQYDMFFHRFRAYCSHIKQDYDRNVAQFNDPDHKLGFWRSWNREGQGSEMHE